MNAETQKRTGLGLLFLLIAFGVSLVLAPLVGAVIASLQNLETLGSESYLARMSVGYFIEGIIVTSLFVAGTVLLLRAFGGYAQFALAALIGGFGFSLVQTAIQSMARSRMQVMAISSGLSLVGTFFSIASSVALLLLLRRAIALASGKSSTVPTVIVASLLAWSLVRGPLFIVVSRMYGVAFLAALSYVNIASHALLTLTFMWLTFRARRAVLGMLLDPTVDASDAYRGPTALR